MKVVSELEIEVLEYIAQEFKTQPLIEKANEVSKLNHYGLSVHSGCIMGAKVLY